MFACPYTNALKFCCKIVLVIVITCFCQTYAAAQDAGPAAALIQQGITLHNQGNYPGAIAKFTDALNADPNNGYAHYELAFSLYAAKKPAEAIPHLEQTIKLANSNVNAAAYALLGSIYDDDNHTQKAVAMYNEVLKINPNYPQIYYNMGLAYYRNKQYQEAEACAVEAITRNTKHASSQRLYALATLHRDKRVNALMALCSFILLEPAGPRAAEAYGNIRHIMQGGVLTDAAGKLTMNVPTQDETENSALNVGIQLTTASAKGKSLSGTSLLEYELTNIFSFAGQLSAKKPDKSFFDKFFVDYFYKLAQSNNMPAFTHFVAGTDAGSAAWVKQNATQMDELAQWLATTVREL